MKTTVKLSEIIDGLEMQSDEMPAFLNIKTGEVVNVTSEDFIKQKSCFRSFLFKRVIYSFS